MDGISAGALGLALAATLGGAVVQGSLGFGFALVVVPALTLIRPDAVPVTILFLALPLTAVMALRERRALDLPGFGWITLGRIPGTAGGVLLLAAVAGGSRSVLFGALVLLAVAFSAAGRDFGFRGRTRVAAGVASGVMGTAAAIGGPPLALVYQRRPGPELRATLALSFFVGVVFSLAALGAAGKVAGWHASLALALLPALAAGLAVSRATARWLDRAWLRPAVLAFAGASGLAAIVTGLLGNG